jgi:hypothetical protein
VTQKKESKRIKAEGGRREGKGVTGKSEKGKQSKEGKLRKWKRIMRGSGGN